MWTSLSEAAEPAELSPFARTVLVEGLNEPMQLEFDGAGRVYWIERATGAMRRVDGTGRVELLGTIPNESGAEAGLVGFLVAGDFERSRQVYAYYAARVLPPEMRLSRFKLGPGDRLDPGSEVVLIRQRWEPASHMGGGMAWDAQGNLYLATGDNTEVGAYSSGLGGAGLDSSRTAGNTNDLRGKILRIHPEADGRYTIPAGNLFPPGTPLTRPEIYTMGSRNPWRIAIDSRTGFLHWGEIGPDAGADSPEGNPRGHDEFNVARRAGNFGWPYVIGYNRPYLSFDYTANRPGPPMDPARLVNLSPRNTGLRELPPATPPALAYPYAVADEFPLLGSGGRMAIGGPVFRRADFPSGARTFPDAYEGKWFIADFVRGWILAATLNEERSRIVALERLLPEERFNNIMDLAFGPNGDLYVLEYGTRWGANNADARISRISFETGR